MAPAEIAPEAGSAPSSPAEPPPRPSVETPTLPPPRPRPPDPDPEPDGIVVVVVDVDTGEPLTGVRAFKARNRNPWPCVTATAPSGEEIVHRLRRFNDGPIEADPSGRILLPKTRGTTSLLLCGDTHAWRHVVVPLSLEGEIRVGLLPGGGMRLRLLNRDAVTQPNLTAHLEGSEGHLGLPGAGLEGEVLLRGLLAGRWTVEVRDGPDGPVAGKGTVEIPAGSIADLVIDLEPPPDHRVEVEGRITVPEGWIETPYGLFFDVPGKWMDERFIGLGPLPGEDEYELGKIRLEPGEYILEVTPFGWRTKITVPPGGVRLDLVLPRPARIRVRVLDVVTGEEIEEPEVSWHSLAEGGSRSYLFTAGYDPVSRTHGFQVPPAEVAINVEAEGYIGKTTYVRCVPGPARDIEIRLERAAILAVRFTRNGETFPADGFEVTAILLAGEKETGWLTQWGYGESITFADLEAGRVRVSVKPVAGFQEFEPREVEVRRGETTEVVFELRRE